MAVPTTATVGALITASKYNEIPANLTAGTTYVPTLTSFSSATIAATVTARYWITGGLCTVIIQAKLGTGTISVSNLTVSLPIAMSTTGFITESTFMPGAQVDMKDVSVANTQFAGAVQYVDANTVRVMRQSASNPGQLLTLSSTTPFTWATLDEISIAFTYPIA